MTNIDKIDAEAAIYEVVHNLGFDDFQAYYNASTGIWEVSNHNQAEEISKIMTKAWHEIGGDELPAN